MNFTTKGGSFTAGTKLAISTNYSCDNGVFTGRLTISRKSTTGKPIVEELLAVDGVVLSPVSVQRIGKQVELVRDGKRVGTVNDYKSGIKQVIILTNNMLNDIQVMREAIENDQDMGSIMANGLNDIPAVIKM